MTQDNEGEKRSERKLNEFQGYTQNIVLLDTDTQLLSLQNDNPPIIDADVDSQNSERKDELYWSDLALFMGSSKSQKEEELQGIEKQLQEISRESSHIGQQIQA